MNKGQKLLNKAKKIIPGGNQLLSKRSEMFLPGYWPTYYKKAKGCKVWDLNNKVYYDFAGMGVTACILGYSNDDINRALIRGLKNGSMCTLNATEEVDLAKELLSIHKWSGMAKFCKSGGEACMVAIRIARAFTKKNNIAFCGYHGWHDWYLAANLKIDSNLDGHLLPGLEPNGVPQNLKGTMLPFNYNKIDELEEIIANHDIGIIKMEVSRNFGPEDGFLEKVRKIATENNIVLIFDECTSGFRETFGGLHKKYGVNPDVALFSKALGNGYAISAIIGKQEVMEATQSTFISSTFWTERIGPVAALKTLEIMEREKSWEQVTNKGKIITKSWFDLAKKYNLPIEISGIPALTNFKILADDWLKYKTLITQEMLKEGYLATNLVYVCIEHTDEIVKDYLKKLDSIFSVISDCENGRDIDKLLEGPVCHSGFERLN